MHLRYIIDVVDVGNCFGGYLLLLYFISLKPFSLILSIDVLSTWSRQMIKRYGANVSPCSTSATMSKLSVSIFPLWMESKALVKSTNNMVASRFFFACTPSRIRQIVKIGDVMDLFLRKPFWFFLSRLSILGSMLLRRRALYILAALSLSLYIYIYIYEIFGYE